MQAVEQTFVPLQRAIDRRRQQRLGLPDYRPWDAAVDPRHLPPLRPFESADQLVRGCRQIMTSLSPELGKQFASMADAGLLDLESRKGKAPGGYMASLHERRLPFIFMNAVGLHRDVGTLLHEAGHALHTLASRRQPILAYREEVPIEFAEVASMGMELLATPHLSVFYSDEDCRRAWREQLEGIVRIFGWTATIDAFQHWLYTHPQHTREQRADAWLQTYRRFAGLEDYSGYEDVLLHSWHRQLHLFLHPFYYVEYGIAQLGALQLWCNVRTAGETPAVRAYRRGLTLGGSRPLPELFQAAGLRFDFTIDTIRPLAEQIQRELDALD
jgi:oligoendopeptidase F